MIAFETRLPISCARRFASATHSPLPERSWLSLPRIASAELLDRLGDAGVQVEWRSGHLKALAESRLGEVQQVGDQTSARVRWPG